MSDATLSKKANCIDDLRRRILIQSLAPGCNLDETALSEAYAISRPPLREVLRQLAGEGYVVLVENRGAQVTQMTHKTMRNFFSVAPMIYAAVARLAAQHATTAQILQIKDTQMLFRAAIRDSDTEQRALLNERFHATLGQMADNDFLWPSFCGPACFLWPSLRRLLIDHTRISMTFYDPRIAHLARQRAVAADQHDQFIAMIEVRDEDGAADLAIAHWELSRAEIESFVTPVSIDSPLGAAPREAATAPAARGTP